MPRILIVEDEPLIALTLEDMLDELGYEAAATAARISDALALIEQQHFDGALLDVNVGRERIDPVADLLASKGCPFVFTTGESRGGVPAQHSGRPCVTKPFRMEDLATALRECVESAPKG